MGKMKDLPPTYLSCLSAWLVSKSALSSPMRTQRGRSCITLCMRNLRPSSRCSNMTNERSGIEGSQCEKNCLRGGG